MGTDSSRCVTCLVVYGQGVWLALQGSAQVKLYHAQTLESLTEVDVAPAVHKMLAGKRVENVWRLLECMAPLRQDRAFFHVILIPL